MGSGGRRLAGRKRTFSFRGEQYRYFFHPYNLSWLNERTVEVPIVRSEMERCGSGHMLEIGNVLSHYGAVEHEVLDKYEKAPHVINQDAVDFNPDRRYDLVLSVSTLEHIGQDEEGEESGKAVDALDNITRLLAPGGKLIASVPLGYNPAVDEIVLQGERPFKWLAFMRRISGNNRWEEVDRDSALQAMKEERYPGTNAVAVFTIVRDMTPGTGV